MMQQELRTDAKLRFRFERDQSARHYSYLVPLDIPTYLYVAARYESPWFDGAEETGIIVLYNGRIHNPKK